MKGLPNKPFISDRAQLEQDVDRILQKISDEGYENLTDDERATLQKASDQKQEKD